MQVKHGAPLKKKRTNQVTQLQWIGPCLAYLNSSKSEMRTLEKEHACGHFKSHVCNACGHFKSHVCTQESKSMHVDIVEVMYAHKKSWAGDLAILKDNRWTQKVRNWYLREIKRKCGRPPTQW